MLEYKTVREYTYNKELVSINCNKCAKQIPVLDWKTGSGINITTTGGYSSKLLDSMDGEYLSFQICDDCLIEFMKTFKIEARIRHR